MKYYYSAKTNSFYPLALKKDYIRSGSWPDDGVEIDEDIYCEFCRQREDKYRMAGNDGFPKWVDIPPPTLEELQLQAEKRKQYLMNNAKEKIDPLQDAVCLGIATEEERISLMEWQKYRVMLCRINNFIPSDIQWPKSPEET